MTPNPCKERTRPGKPGPAAQGKRFAGIKMENNGMATINAGDVSALLLENTTLRLVESNIF